MIQANRQIKSPNQSSVNLKINDEESVAQNISTIDEGLFNGSEVTASEGIDHNQSMPENSAKTTTENSKESLFFNAAEMPTKEETNAKESFSTAATTSTPTGSFAGGKGKAGKVSIFIEIGLKLKAIGNWIRELKKSFDKNQMVRNINKIAKSNTANIEAKIEKVVSQVEELTLNDEEDFIPSEEADNSLKAIELKNKAEVPASDKSPVTSAPNNSPETPVSDNSIEYLISNNLQKNIGSYKTKEIIRLIHTIAKMPKAIKERSQNNYNKLFFNLIQRLPFLNEKSDLNLIANLIKNPNMFPSPELRHEFFLKVSSLNNTSTEYIVSELKNQDMLHKLHPKVLLNIRDKQFAIETLALQISIPTLFSNLNERKQFLREIYALPLETRQKIEEQLRRSGKLHMLPPKELMLFIYNHALFLQKLKEAIPNALKDNSLTARERKSLEEWRATGANSGADDTTLMADKYIKSNKRILEYIALLKKEGIKDSNEVFDTLSSIAGFNAQEKVFGGEFIFSLMQISAIIAHNFSNPSTNNELALIAN